jgi:hypothetical protein
MSFQFTCPQGHLLEGDPAHAGMQSQCPMCGAMFIIPQPPAPAPTVTPGPGPGFPGIAPQGIGPQIGPVSGAPGGFGLNFGPPPEEPQGPAAIAEAMPAAPEPAVPPEPEPDPIVHILCPNGHELETPMSMVGTDAMCPHCEAQFRLRYEDSREYREKKQKEREHREAMFGRKALNFAIVTAVLVMVGLIGLMVFYATQK